RGLALEGGEPLLATDAPTSQLSDHAKALRPVPVLHKGPWRRHTMVILRPVNLRWIRGAADDPNDLCAHGQVQFRIGHQVLLGADRGEDLTVSAAALYLLRTLAVPHTRAAPVGD